MSFTSRKSISASAGEILKEKRTHDEDQIDATAAVVLVLCAAVVLSRV